MLPLLIQQLLKDWDTVFPSFQRPADISYLGVAGGAEGGTTTFFAFGPRQALPYFIVKVGRDATGGELIINERDALLRLHDAGLPLASTVPNVVRCTEIEGTWMLVESTVEGAPMSVTVAKPGQPSASPASRNFKLATDWLAAMQMQALSSEMDADTGAGLDSTVDQFVTSFNLSAEERAFIDQTITKESLTDARLVLRHGDYCPQNILLRGASSITGVVDWAFSQPSGLPLHDLLFFTSVYVQNARQSSDVLGFTQALRYAFFNQNPFSQVVANHVLDYCRQMGIPTSTAKSLFCVFIMEQAMFEYRKVERAWARGWSAGFTAEAGEQGGPQTTPKVAMWVELFRTYVATPERLIFQ